METNDKKIGRHIHKVNLTPSDIINSTFSLCKTPDIKKRIITKKYTPTVSKNFLFTIQKIDKKTNRIDPRTRTDPAFSSVIIPLSINKIWNNAKKIWTRVVADKMISPKSVNKLFFNGKRNIYTFNISQ